MSLVGLSVLGRISTELLRPKANPIDPAETVPDAN